MTNKNFEKIRLRSTTDSSSVEGELVVEHAQAYMVAVGGKVSVFSKSQWQRVTGSFEDVFGGLFNGSSNNDPFSRLYGRE